MALARFFALAALALFDAALSGFRAAAGRSARIDKRRYYALALAKGALAGCVLALGTAGLAWLLGANASGAAEYWSAVAVAAARLSHPLRPGRPRARAPSPPFARSPTRTRGSIASTLVFGPLTLLRPAVLVCGCAWAVGWPPRADVAALAFAACAGLLLVERGLCAVDCLPE